MSSTKVAVSRQLRFGSLFSGIGGMDLGLERAGMRCAWQVEADGYCQRILEKHWPHVPRFDDVRTVGAAELVPVDLVAGGFPCQDISVAGKGVGIEGDRSGLWREMHRIIAELLPEWVLVENVPALRNRGADRVLGDLAAAGYTCWPVLVGAVHAGAPHRRLRVWIVAQRMVVAKSERWSREGNDERRHAGESGARLADTELNALRFEQQRLSGGWADGVPNKGQAVAGEDGGESLAHSNSERREEQWSSGLFDVKRTTFGNNAHRRHRWPARPGERQHEWEEPRTVESTLGVPADGLSCRLAGRNRRAALRALGNACVPQVVEMIGRAIVRAAVVALLLAGTARAGPSLDLPRIDIPPMPTPILAPAGTYSTALIKLVPNVVDNETAPMVDLRDPIAEHLEAISVQLDRIEKLVTPKRQPIKRNSWVIRKFLFLHGHCQGEKISTAKCRTPVGCQVDHIQPLGCGGADKLDNLQLLCGEALQIKNAHDIVQCRGKSGGK